MSQSSPTVHSLPLIVPPSEQLSARRPYLAAASGSYSLCAITARADPQLKPYAPPQIYDGQRSLPLRRQLRRRAAARLVQTLSLDAADGLAGDSAAATATVIAAGRPRPASSPYAWAALAVAAAGGSGRAAAGGGLRAEVLRAALRRSGASGPHVAVGCGCGMSGQNLRR